jgi:hypothetical protein
VAYAELLPDERGRAAQRFCGERPPGMPSTASPSSASSPITPRPTMAATGTPPATSSASSAATPSPTAPGQTAKPKH